MEGFDEAYVKNSLTGFICLCLLFFSWITPGHAQEPPPTQPAPQPTGGPQLPPPPPKVPDVRMPGEAGFFVGVMGWSPFGPTFIDKGLGAIYSDLSYLKIPGRPKIGGLGAEISIAAGLHNSLRLSYFSANASGNTTAPTDLVLFTQAYSKGDYLSANYRLQDMKLSFDYLTWPFPVGSRKFRLKTLWQMQYVSIRSSFDAPVKSSTPDSSGNITPYETKGSKSFFTPTVGLGVARYAARSFRFEANASGFMLPHRLAIGDVDATIAYRAGRIEARAGVKGFYFKTSPKADYYLRGTLGGAFVGIRWCSD